MNHYLSPRPQFTLRRRRHYQLILSLGLSSLILLGFYQIFLAQAEDPPPIDTLPYRSYLPLVYTKLDAVIPPGDVPMPDEEEIVWDTRLTERGARLVKAQVTPGAGYWRLIKARWFDPVESEGRHHILIELLDAAGERVSGVPIHVRWANGEATVTSERKAGEAYAANYAMYALAPAYAAQPAANAPADRVEGMGLGTIEKPQYAFHTSYGLVWQWRIAADPTPTPTITTPVTVTLTPIGDVSPIIPITQTATPTATPTLIPITDTVTPTATFALTATPVHTPTPTATTSATPTASSTATPTPTATPTAPGLAQAIVVGCQPNDRGSRFEGYVYVNGQPANGYRIVFSYEADGRWVTQPAISGGSTPGFYAHIISVGVARAGKWYTWLIDQNSRRISTLAAFTTDGEGGACNVAFVNFLIQAN